MDRAAGLVAALIVGMHRLGCVVVVGQETLPFG
jgi:hypothetical protein